MNTAAKEAFLIKCKEAKPARGAYVSLYVDNPFYGGPEEGGWWGHDYTVVAYHQVATEEEAEALKAKIEELAAKLNEEAKDSFGKQCQAEIDWCEARGIDDYNTVFGEVDGKASYFVMTEDHPGSHNSKGCRHYE